MILLLASTTSHAGKEAASWLNFPTHWPAQGEFLQWCQNMSPGIATLLVLGGLAYLVFGWYAHKWLVTVNAALIGAYMGAILGNRAGSAAVGACVGAFVSAAIAFPLLKYAVAFMGGVYGAILGASMWQTANLHPNLVWAGALSGLIAFGLLAFIVFRGSVIMYMSLQGSVMLILGLLGLIFKYQDLAPHLAQKMTVKPFLLPLSILIPALLGLIYQQTQYPAAEAKKK